MVRHASIRRLSGIPIIDFVIETVDLRKTWGEQEVLHGISLSVRRGRLTGFLGPNGAGKTTTIRILLGLVHRSGGSIRLFGQESGAGEHRLRARIGYLPADVRFPSGLNGRGVLRLYARARRVVCLAESDRLAELLRLDLDKPVRKYSTGMKQKLGLIQALMHQPELLILDEPTSGLDPLIRENVFGELREYVHADRTILFSSHSLPEVEHLCDDVIVLRDGHIIESQPITVLRERALRRITMDFGTEPHVPDSFPAAFRILDRGAGRVTATWSDGIASLLEWLNGLPLRDVVIDKPDLEELFLTWYSDDDDGFAVPPASGNPEPA